MPEASSWTAVTVVTAVGAGTGVVAGPALSAFGIDPYSIGAGLLGCVIAQLLSPAERLEPLRIAGTALGSVLVASFGAPYIAPVFEVGKVTPEHASAVASALLGGSAKPAYTIVKARFEAWFANWLPPTAGKPLPPAGPDKGPNDA